MKKIKITLAFLLGFTAIKAQQVPVYSQNSLNFYLSNPAAVAAQNETRFMLHHRQQWVGLQDAPRTSAITLETPLGGGKYALGLKLNTDQVHIFKTTYGEVDFRYRLPITEDHLISFGLGGSFIQRNIDFNKVRVLDQSESNLLDYNSSQMTFDADFGLLYQWSDLTAGFSINQLMNSKFSYEDDITQQAASYNNLRHFNLFATYDFELSKKPITITPTVFVRHLQGANLPIELNTVVTWDKKFWGGLGYRQNFGVVIIAGAQVFDQLILGYSYDVSTGVIRNFNSGSHEISIGYRIPRKSKTGSQNTTQISRSLRNQQEEIELLREENEELSERLYGQEKALKEQKDEVNKLKGTYEEEKPEMEKIIEEHKVEGFDPDSKGSGSATLSSEDKARIDKLEEEIEDLKKQISKNNTSSNLDSSEIMDAINQEIEKLKQNSPNEKVNDSNESTGKFFTIVGAYFNMEDAKAYQRMLKREAGIDTRITARQDRKFFFVYTNEYDKIDAALREMNRLKKSGLKKYINGDFWIHKN
jgi:type IX secretion system PorP/SprF family membrane protein